MAFRAPRRRNLVAVLERPANIPDAPGSYQFKDADGRIIYVGKARSLRQRLSNYFQDRSALHPRTAQMMDQAASVEWITVRSDVEAIMLEYTLIKVNRPRFNVRLVDDKSYPYLAITLDEDWPRALVMRGARRKGTRYFGPYSHAWAIRDTLDLLLRSFPIRTCSNAKFARHQRLGRPCLLFHIERCCGPCTEPVEPAEYEGYLEELTAFLEGRTAPVIRRLESEMLAASETLEYERAALLRDRLGAVRLAAERQEMVADAHEDLDAIGLADGELEAAVQVLHVRSGRVVGRQGFILEKVEPLTRPALIGRVLEQCYGETPLGIPREVLVPDLPEDDATYAAWLGERRVASDRQLQPVLVRAAAGDSHAAGETYRRAGAGEDPGANGRDAAARRGRPPSAKVEIRVPQRGRKRALLAVAAENAAEQLTRHRLRRASDLTTRAQALEQLQQQLGLHIPPLRIECYDMSHLQGTDYVGSMVVMEDGLPKRSDYRRFKVSAVQGNDDYGAMYEVLTRRLRRLVPPPDGSAPVAASGAGGEAAAARARGRRAGGDRRRAGARRRRGRPQAAVALCLPAAAAASRRRQGPARRRGARARGARPHGDCRDRRAGQAVRRGLRPRPGGADPPAARLPGHLPAAADPRRGAPLRHRLPPGTARQADDQGRARRHPRPRADPAQAADQRARQRAGRARRVARGAARPRLAARAGRRGRLRAPQPRRPAAFARTGRGATR